MQQLSARQTTFAQIYAADIENGNGTEAATKAGYSPKTAHSQASRLLKNVKVKAIIDKIRSKGIAKAEVTVERIIGELASMAFSNIDDFITIQEDGTAYVNLNDLTRAQLGALQEITVDEYIEGHGDDARAVKKVRIKLADKTRNLEILGRHLKMFDTSLNLQGELTIADRIIKARVRVEGLEAPA